MIHMLRGAAVGFAVLTLACGGGGGGSSTATPVQAAPVITGFAAGPATITAGGSSTLAWGATGATGVRIDQGVGAVSGTSVSVRPSVTTTYTLTATNPAGNRTATTTVTVVPPATANLVASGTAPLYGATTVTLTPTFSGATQATLGTAQGGSDVCATPASGVAIPVQAGGFTAGKTYWLRAVNSVGDPVDSSVTITPQTVGVAALSPAAPSLAVGSTCLFSASVSGAADAAITWSASGPGGAGSWSGSTWTAPLVPGSYTVTATARADGTRFATTTVTVFDKPVISAFTASPSNMAVGQGATLNWTVSGASNLAIDQGVGPVTGTSVSVNPATTTSYTLTATNAAGSTTAQATVTVGSRPVITSFTSSRSSLGPGQSCTLNWSASGATNLSIDSGIGNVAGTSFSVSPIATTRYTLTASNAFGSVSASVQVDYLALVQINSQLYKTEHCLFIIPSPAQVNWTDPNAGSVYSAANIDNYVATLKTYFPDDYFMVVVAANQVTSSLSPLTYPTPNVLTYRHIADGIGQGSITGVGVPNICRYNIGTTPGVFAPVFAVFDHEIGHNWGVQIGIELGSGHWYANTTVNGQMADTYTNDGYVTVKQLAGDPTSGFTWTSLDNLTRNETETFSDQDLYAMGLQPVFPDTYVLTTPVYNPDHSVSYSAAAKYDHAWAVGKNGPRNPSYRSSEKQFRLGFVYIARDLGEVQTSYQPVERSITHFENAEQVDASHFRFQVPFLVETKFRASIKARLADLDGNATPTLTLLGPAYLTSSDGSVTVPFQASDPDGTPPVVSCLPASAQASISSGSVHLQGLSSGTHFFTLKAEDPLGKKAFAHFVVDVN